MKIAVVVPGFPTISETFIINHITGLIDEGHDVTIIALRKNVSPQRHQIVDDYQLLSRTVFVKNAPSKKMLCRIYSAWLTFTCGLRYPCKTIKTLHHLLFVDQAEFYQKLFLAFALFPLRCDIYHFHFGQVGRLGAAVKKMGFPMKVITSFHGADVNQVPLEKEENYYSELFELGDHFIANTNFTKQQAVQLGCDDRKISVIPVSLHIRDFKFRPRNLANNETVQILTVGRLVEKKGCQYSIQAIARLIEEGFNVHYTIAGDGPLREPLENLVAELNISEHVTFTGEVTQEQVMELYGISHIFVLSSVTADNGDREGQALVLQEAQACGLPVVSTWHNGIPDGVLDGQSGSLVPEKDVKALADAIKKHLENPASWGQMGQAGRAFVGKGYDTKVTSARLAHLYEDIKKTPR